MPKSIAGPEGNISVEKFNVYKEKDEQRADYGKYKFYAQIGEMCIRDRSRAMQPSMDFMLSIRCTCY